MHEARNTSFTETDPATGTDTALRRLSDGHGDRRRHTATATGPYINSCGDGNRQRQGRAQEKGAGLEPGAKAAHVGPAEDREAGAQARLRISHSDQWTRISDSDQ